MDASCHNCGESLELSTDSSIGRKESCPHCDADLHVCVNCRYYDPSAYNECREPQAERVLVKDRSNFCDYFEFNPNRSPTGSGVDKDAQRKALDSLFK